MAVVCPRCGEENPDRARYCMACTEPLAVELPAREERKVVSVLFVDLVGFTAASETADPEDVRARLQAYHARTKSEIERFGGTVEKFVGDAVMAVFGAPVAHEDDAERAVRAGLRILEAMDELVLEARAAVNTGEAVVSLAARPERGEGIVAGDVVNTAARLQSSAPAGGIVAGDQTYWATRHVIDYEPLEPVTVKGKSDPVPLWLARGARSRFGVDLEPGRATPFVGRDDEVEVLRQVYARTLRESACHLVTLVGEPGIGKSRLVAELREFVDARQELVFWRQGRCLPYGEGIAFWAIGEIVKAHAGVLESDGAETAREKIARMVESLGPAQGDAGWIEGELARLVGAARAGEGGGDRDESFAAWRTFLETVAAERPLVAVVEDLHWADAALLAFLEYLLDWTTGVPLLVICTARPELYELDASWSGGKRNATTISLSPLSSAETARLIAALLERAVLPAETQQALLDRAGGNPLYAEQFVRMLHERPAGEEVAVPETVQALIAARLDTLGSERKGLLQDAAVIGKVFWSGAVAAIGGLDERTVREGLHELVRRELIRPARLSSVEGHSEFAFGHGLVRDVAYAQIPRGDRARKHEAAARWIEGVAGERVADYAELLAHHYREALGLARAAGLSTEALEDGARRFLVLAAERAAFFDAARGRALMKEALALAPPGHPARGRMLIAAAESTDTTDDARLLDEAIAELRSAGDEVGVGKALILLAHHQWVLGDAPASNAAMDEAVRLLERHEPGPELAHAYARLAGGKAIGGDAEAGLEWAAKCIELSERLGLQNFALRALQFRGIARCDLGDAGGLDDLRDSLRTALERGLSQEANIGFVNYGSNLWLLRGAAEALPVYEEGIAFHERRGAADTGTWTLAESTWPLFDLGRWDELLDAAKRIEQVSAEVGHGQWSLMAQASKARVIYYRGGSEEARAIARELLPRVREVGDPQIVVPAVSLAALVEPDPATALAFIEELLSVRGWPLLYPDSARVCVRHGAFELADRLVRAADRQLARAQHVGTTMAAILADARGRQEEAARLYADAARRWSDYPFALERGLCLLGLARSSGDAESAAEAADILRSLGTDELAVAAA